jgi:putative DNA primase/helicase
MARPRKPTHGSTGAGAGRRPFRRRYGEDAIRHSLEHAERRRVWIGNPDLDAASREVLEAVIDSEQPSPSLFRYGDAPVRVELGDTGRAYPVALTADRLRHEIAARVDCQKAPRPGAPSTDPVDETEPLSQATRRQAANKARPAYPPIAIARNILAMPNLPLPPLYGFVGHPVFAADSKLVTVRGYDDRTGLYLDWPGDLKIPKVPREPSSVEKARALKLIAEEALGDFPFASEADKANAIGMYLTPFVRPMIPGCTPLHLVDKHTPGSGGTLLVEAASLIATGRSAHIMTEGRDDEEWRKRITSQLMTGAEMICIDNVRRKLDSAALSAAITAGVWEDRVLSRSEIASLPVRCLWMATGNNVTTSNEVARRCVHIRLDPQSEKPWQRDGFRHPRLLAWVRENRAELVWAALIFIQSWIAAGCPKGPARAAMGMFDDWEQIIGDVLHHNGVDSFLDNAPRFYDQADNDTRELARFLLGWWTAHASAPVGSGLLIGIAENLDPPMDLGRGEERSRKIVLGLQLRKLVDGRHVVTTAAGQRLTLAIRDAGQKDKAQLWKLDLAEGS